MSVLASQTLTISFQNILIIKKFVLIFQEVSKSPAYTTVVALVDIIILLLKQIPPCLVLALL